MKTKYILDPEALEKSDILLSRSDDRESRIIRQASSSEYSHAIIYVGDYSCIESNGLGVQAQNIQRMLFDNIEDVLVLRLIDYPGQKPINDVVEYARQKVGTEYSTGEARVALTKSQTSEVAKETNRQFCTRYVAQSYAHAGIKLVDNTDYCSPADIQKSTLLRIVPNVLIAATEAQIKFAVSENPLNRQEEIHNFIFESTREQTGKDIQTFEQLAKHLLENPDDDEKITQIVRASGYLEMWKLDSQNNPENYDYDAFVKYFEDPEQRRYIGREIINREPEIRARFEVNLQTMEFGYRFYQQEYFRVMIDLYNQLIILSNQRQTVGRKALMNS